jgi:type IV pilus assembly protein PilB
MLDSSHFLIRSLVEEGRLKDADVKRARESVALTGGDLLSAIVKQGSITTRDLAICRATLCEYPFVDLGQFEIDHHNAAHLPRAAAERLTAFPLFWLEGCATVAMLDPLNLGGIDQLRQILKVEVQPVLCDPDQLKALIARAYTMVRATGDAGGDASTPGSAPDEGDLTTGEEPVVMAVKQILAGAVAAGASDVHIGPDEHELLVRYRVDGVLLPQQGPGKGMHAGIVQRLKVLAQLDVTQTRRPQDGKFRFSYADGYVDIRLSLLPTIHGENAVMRLLRPATNIGSVDELGMPRDMTEWFRDAISRPHGMVLATGPTGSGKTTTLYTALSALNTPDVNIMTIEDPVELRVPMIRQIQCNAEIGLTFAAALRSILRQDPDVVLVGEIRDGETARIAVQAAMTGHLVLSSLHTNDAPGAVARLRDLGVPNFAISNALLAVVAQRLVRKLCPECAEVDETEGAAAFRQGFDGLLLRAKGCRSCMSVGYRGRVGVFEMLRVTKRVRETIERDGSSREVGQVAAMEGLRPMRVHGQELVRLGITSLEELAKLSAVLDEAPSAAAALKEAA